MLCHISKKKKFPLLPVRSLSVFSDVHTEDVVELLEIKFTEVWGPSMTGSTLRVFFFKFIFLKDFIYLFLERGERREKERERNTDV